MRLRRLQQILGSDRCQSRGLGQHAQCVAFTLIRFAIGRPVGIPPVCRAKADYPAGLNATSFRCADDKLTFGCSISLTAGLPQYMTGPNGTVAPNTSHPHIWTTLTSLTQGGPKPSKKQQSIYLKALHPTNTAIFRGGTATKRLQIPQKRYNSVFPKNAEIPSENRHRDTINECGRSSFLEASFDVNKFGRSAWMRRNTLVRGTQMLRASIELCLPQLMLLREDRPELASSELIFEPCLATGGVTLANSQPSALGGTMADSAGQENSPLVTHGVVRRTAPRTRR